MLAGAVFIQVRRWYDKLCEALTVKVFNVHCGCDLVCKTKM